MSKAAPVFPIDNPGTTTAFFCSPVSLLEVASIVAFIVPDNNFHGPLSPVGAMGDGSSRFPHASDRMTVPALSSSEGVRG